MKLVSFEDSNKESKDGYSPFRRYCHGGNERICPEISRGPNGVMIRQSERPESVVKFTDEEARVLKQALNQMGY